MTEHRRIQLAIVIPAWRARHLPAALASLRGQTDQRFHLYIGDDGSPDDLRSIVDDHCQTLNVTYHRFSTNLGNRDLVAHWERCLKLTQDEPWIWLFSDDDIAEPDCVAAFYQSLENDSGVTTLFRFNTIIIDDHGSVTAEPAPHPDQETALELIQAMVVQPEVPNPRFWCAPDHVFARSTFQKTGGFVNYPMALYSDYATWIRIAERGAVRTISGPKIKFRKYPQGTSSGGLSRFYDAYFNALTEFLHFHRHFLNQRAPQRFALHHRLARRYIFTNLYRTPELHIHFLKPQTIEQCHRAIGGPRWTVALQFYFYKIRLCLRNNPVLNRIARWRLQKKTSKSSASHAS